jgi:hypothetical protein
MGPKAIHERSWLELAGKPLEQYLLPDPLLCPFHKVGDLCPLLALLEHLLRQFTALLRIISPMITEATASA